MARVCEVTNKRPMSGNNVSHAHNKTKRSFKPNLHMKRFWVANENRYATLLVSAAGIRTIDKIGIEQVLQNIKARRKKNDKK